MMRTAGDVFDSAMQCTTKEEAEAWLKREIAEQAKTYSRREAEARDIILDNLGYFSGYYSLDVAKKVYELFGAVHPVLGTPEERAKLTPEEIFQKGAEWAQKK